MNLAIAQKSYVKQGVMPGKLNSSLNTIKRAIEAFEAFNKPRAITTLYAAYGLLPRGVEGLKIGVDIVESLTQLKAYEEALEVVHDLEEQYGLMLMGDNLEARRYFFRAFANAAEAYEALAHDSQASRYRKLALDQVLELDDHIDLEMLQLFS